jgi:hypothetical protein
VRGSAVSGGLMAGAGESAAGARESSVRTRESTAPRGESTAGAGESTAPGGESAVRAGESTAGAGESTAPGGESAVRAGELPAGARESPTQVAKSNAPGVSWLRERASRPPPQPSRLPRRASRLAVDGLAGAGRVDCSRVSWLLGAVSRLSRRASRPIGGELTAAAGELAAHRRVGCWVGESPAPVGESAVPAGELAVLVGELAVLVGESTARSGAGRRPSWAGGSSSPGRPDGLPPAVGRPDRVGALMMVR